MSKEEGSSLAWVGLAISICIGSFRISLGSFHAPGPGFFPFISGAVLGVLAVLVYFQARRKRRSASEAEKRLWTNRSGLKKVALIMIALIIYGASMPFLGFLISTFIFLFFVLRAIEPQPWVLVLFESVLATGLSYLIFEIWLQAQLPGGIFP